MASSADTAMIISFSISYGMGYGKDILLGSTGKRGIVLSVVPIAGRSELALVGLVPFSIVELIIVAPDMMRTIVPGLFGGPLSSSPPTPSPADAASVPITPRLGPCGMPVFKLKGTKVEFDEEDKGITNPKAGFPPLPLATGWETPGAPPPIPIPPILSPLLLPGLALGGGGKE